MANPFMTGAASFTGAFGNAFANRKNLENERDYQGGLREEDRAYQEKVRGDERAYQEKLMQGKMAEERRQKGTNLFMQISGLFDPNNPKTPQEISQQLPAAIEAFKQTPGAAFYWPYIAGDIEMTQKMLSGGGAGMRGLVSQSAEKPPEGIFKSYAHPFVGKALSGVPFGLGRLAGGATGIGQMIDKAGMEMKTQMPPLDLRNVPPGQQFVDPAGLYKETGIPVQANPRLRQKSKPRVKKGF